MSLAESEFIKRVVQILQDATVTAAPHEPGGFLIGLGIGLMREQGLSSDDIRRVVEKCIAVSVPDAIDAAKRHMANRGVG